jgi:hypothetical protein
VLPSAATDGGDAAGTEQAKRELRLDVLTVVQSAVVPVVAGIQRALACPDPPEGVNWAGLGQRLEALHAEVIEVVDRLTASPPARQLAEVRRELFAELHGPVLGRLAACAMALNFHSDPSPSDPRDAAAEAMATRVGAHLDAVCRDLAVLRRRA